MGTKSVINGKRINIVINGAPLSGKDTFVKLCEIFSRKFSIHCCSSVDKVKEAAFKLGWDGIKDKDGRQFLSDLKDLSTEIYDGPMKYMEEKMKSFKEPYIAFFMIRESEEIQKFCDKFDHTYTLLIERDTFVKFNNHADSNINNFTYDFTISNNGTIEDLIKSVKYFLSCFVVKDDGEFTELMYKKHVRG